MFGMMFGSDWVKKFCDLVRIWGSYEGLKVNGYRGFIEKFELERSCGELIREKEEKILVYGYIGVTHGRANIGTGRANLLENGGVG